MNHFVILSADYGFTRCNEVVRRCKVGAIGWTQGGH